MINFMNGVFFSEGENPADYFPKSWGTFKGSVLHSFEENNWEDIGHIAQFQYEGQWIASPSTVTVVRAAVDKMINMICEATEIEAEIPLVKTPILPDKSY